MIMRNSMCDIKKEITEFYLDYFYEFSCDEYLRIVENLGLTISSRNDFQILRRLYNIKEQENE